MLHEYEIVTNQAEGDADHLIAKTALQLSRNESTLCLAKDTDILVMLVERADEQTQLYFSDAC